MGAGTVVPGGRRGVPLTEKILRASFIFATKRFADSGAIEKYKARMVVDGSGQVGGSGDSRSDYWRNVSSGAAGCGGAAQADHLQVGRRECVSYRLCG